ncbi:hypothetical protein NE237_029152 [Protea cynaroides]|uniref:Uncharacterized protein n=1 Tax=Protea cynaroides TaxID=273540 RepID=A0A9Q0GRR3_9MAGN|nr:hypothetical protein NE237_029152 [Protea cynaroides]
MGHILLLSRMPFWLTRRVNCIIGIRLCHAFFMLVERMKDQSFFLSLIVGGLCNISVQSLLETRWRALQHLRSKLVGSSASISSLEGSATSPLKACWKLSASISVESSLEALCKHLRGKLSALEDHLGCLLFDPKSHLPANVEVMGAYGYNIEHILMVDIIPDASVRKAMNKITQHKGFNLLASTKETQRRFFK